VKASIRLLQAAEITRLHKEILTVYSEAFSGPPYNKPLTEMADFGQSLPRQLDRPGFRFAAALDDAGWPVGIAYGHALRPEYWWYQNVSQAMDPALVALWLPGAFEFVELAVVPAAQGQGIGGRLHDFLLDGIDYDRAILSTLDRETAASHLYRRRGWVTLLDGHYFPGVNRPYQIMGRELRPTPG
jgi:GNAT superfamily N-acetyltransferase